MIFGRVKDLDFSQFVRIRIQHRRQISLPKTLISHQNLFQNRCFITNRSPHLAPDRFEC